MIVRYDMICENDHMVEMVRRSGDTSAQPCEKCGLPLHWKPSCQAQPQFKPCWHEHLDHYPVKLESREQYREELKKRDLRGPYHTPGANLSEV